MADSRDWVADRAPVDEPVEVPAVASAFAAGGPIARVLGERYRYREGQVAMAELVRQALNEDRPALIEAGTGCGKSFAYLIPVIWSGARAFVSTANKTLQTQLWEKDIPALRQVAPRPFTAALMKGRKNYVCPVKMRALRQQVALPGLRDSLDDLLARLPKTPSGDVEDLRLSSTLRDEVTAGERDCLGRDCPLVSRCYYELAKARAEDADIVVINHAVLVFNLLVPMLTPRSIVVVDEAHELERYAIDALRLSLEYTTVPSLINDEAVMGHVPDDLRLRAVLHNNELFTTLAGTPQEDERRWTVPGRLEPGIALSNDLQAVYARLLETYPPVPGADEGDERNARHQAMINWATELANEVRLLAEEPPSDQVRYCEEQPQGVGLDQVVLFREPLQVAEFLERSLFTAVRRVVCTGATLTVGNEFGYLRRQLGVPASAAIEHTFDSPFDFPNQALLYTPNGLEPVYGPGEDEYLLNLGREVWRLLQASRGRAFVLCTSARRMHELYDLVSPHLEYTCLCQGGELSRAELLEQFQRGPQGVVLFATRSFWEGVDIPGEALSLVIIDKLPFTPHRDPVIVHRQELIRARGGDPFSEMQLPEAILALKQGVGRLIRSEIDRGVMAILDSRINTRGYGAKIIASLPPARHTRRIADVRAFFAEH
ncbi:MAG: hypothetical protein GX601_17000 [Anaerolineales bacterium]|nr:hypothetical protein [Anaerolineales bacterium]